MKYSVYAFTLLTMLPGIPVVSIMTRYNLLSGDLCSPGTAKLLAVGLPWVLVGFTYNRGILLDACNWTALLVQGYTNFVLPCAMYLEARRRHKYTREILAEQAEARGEEPPRRGIGPAGTMRRYRNPVVASIPEDEELDVTDLEQRLLSREDLIEVDECDFQDEPIFEALPAWAVTRGKAQWLAGTIMWSTLVLSTFALVFNIACAALGIQTDDEGSRRRVLRAVGLV